MTPEDLVEIDAIKRLKYAYFRCLDQKRWEEMATLLTDDVVVHYSGGRHQYAGAAEVIEWMRSSMDADSFHSSHRGNHPEIELDGDDRARGVWAFDDVVIETSRNVNVIGAGFYDDRYRTIDGRWLVESTGYKRTFEDVQMRDGSGCKIAASW